nr:hypothetical protein Itr_chr09CG03140 [Ipomoea trifida]
MRIRATLGFSGGRKFFGNQENGEEETRMAPLAKGLVSGEPPFSSYAARSRPMSASRLPHACFSGHVHGAGGSGCP